MRYSKLFGKTNRTAKEYESVNATLLIKGGFIDQVMSGVYTYLPLGLRVLAKIENIVRGEMDKIGNQIFMPAIVPLQLWRDTKRLDSVDVLFKVCGANEKSRKKNKAEYVLNSTHEEVVTPLAKKFSFSYKDFPFAVYQIQTKFRNEPRAKSGLMRGREFRMKDLYSFHKSEDDLMRYYNDEAIPAYKNIFEKLGLGEDTVIVLASGGDFTKAHSHEFQTICETGEDTLFFSKEEGVYYNKEIAPAKAPAVKYKDEEMGEKEEVLGEGIIGVEELAKLLNIPIEKTTKTLLFETDEGKIIAAAVRGGYDVNEEKLKKAVECKSLELASEDKVRQVTGAEVGYAGVLNLLESVEVFMDDSMEGRINFETGANRTNYHTINVNFERDLPTPTKFYDIKMAKKGDISPKTGEVYQIMRASEVGNIFPLNIKFSDALDYKYTDESGGKSLVYMGCYGLGTSRVMGVLVEKFHDEKGIVWPDAIAPFHVHLVDLGGDGEGVYKTLVENGVEVLWDDRENASAGAKFADADLIGCPVRLVVSERNGDKVEWKYRNKKESELLSLEEVLERFKDY
jgi:prolyl-tRNA synthetase